MFAELLDSVAALARESAASELVKVDGAHRRTWLRTGGTITEVKLDPPTRAHALHSFNDVLAMAIDPELAPSPQLFHDESKVCLMLDRAERSELMVCHLLKTDRFARLAGMARSPLSGPPSQVVRAIRFELQGIGCDALLASLQRVDFTSKATSSSTTRHGADSLGRAVEAAVQGTVEIPETFVARLPVYSNEGLRGIHVDVRCGVHIDSSAGVITVQPLADEVTNAINIAQQAIIDLISRAAPNVPRYWGVPILQP